MPQFKGVDRTFIFMCGRFTQTHLASEIAQAFGLQEVPDWQPRYNLAPTQNIPAIIEDPESQEFSFKSFRWGLIPSWAKDPAIGAKMINARAETVREKPTFREAFKRRRCLIIADGFYEWKKQGSKKQPFYFRLETGDPFAFAGLWERWQSPNGTIETCTIITTEANELAATVHDRMPVILPAKDYDRWLDPELQTSEELQSLLRPYDKAAMTVYPVSPAVNSPAHDSPDCVEALV